MEAVVGCSPVPLCSVVSDFVARCCLWVRVTASSRLLWPEPSHPCCQNITVQVQRLGWIEFPETEDYCSSCISLGLASSMQFIQDLIVSSGSADKGINCGVFPSVLMEHINWEVKKNGRASHFMVMASVLLCLIMINIPHQLVGIKAPFDVQLRCVWPNEWKYWR